MLRNPEHAERRRSGPDDEIAFVAQRQFQHVEKLAMDEREEDGVLNSRLAVHFSAVAEYQAERVGRLVVCAGFDCCICLCGVGVREAGDLEGIGEIRGCEAVTEEFGESAAGAGGGEVVVNVGFASSGKEEEPILLYL